MLLCVTVYCQDGPRGSTWCDIIGGECVTADTDCDTKHGQQLVENRCEHPDDPYVSLICCVPKNEANCSHHGGNCQQGSTCNMITSYEEAGFCGNQEKTQDIVCCIPKKDTIWRLVFDLSTYSVAGLLYVWLLIKIFIHRKTVKPSDEESLLDEAFAVTEGGWLEQFMKEFIEAVYRMSKKKTGALIVIQHKQDLNLEKICRNGSVLDAQFSSGLLEIIFHKESSLASGAVVIRLEETAIIRAAKVVFSDTRSDGRHMQIDADTTMGTRFQDALVFTQNSNDVLAIVVSEHTGDVALIVDGTVQDDVKPTVMISLIKAHLNGYNFAMPSWLEQFIAQLIGSVYRMSTKQTGALIVIQHEEDINLTELSEKGSIMDSQFSGELLEGIFHKDSVVHDGAVVIRLLKNAIIHAAKVVFPMEKDCKQTQTELNTTMGTRHRAALSFSQISRTALVIVVSEQTGKVAFVVDGMMQADVKAGILTTLIKTHIDVHNFVGLNLE